MAELVESLQPAREADAFRPGLVGFVTFKDGTRIELRAEEAQVRINDVPIALAWTEPHFGGRRAWFVCPRCRRRCAVVYGKARHWACRCCWRANYPSQKEAPFDRLVRRAGTLRGRLGDRVVTAPIDHVELTGMAPDKPPRMHWRTYRRLADERARLERQAGQLYCAQATRLLDRLTRKEGRAP